jgi:hypothetical protein
MTWCTEGVSHLRKNVPKGYDIVRSKYMKWYGVVIPKEMHSFSPMFENIVPQEIEVIGFTVNPCGQVFFKATDIMFCYGYIEDLSGHDFFSFSDTGGDSFCTLTTVKAAFLNAILYTPESFKEMISEQNAKKLLSWLWIFQCRLDVSAFRRHQMFRIGFTKEGINAWRMVPDKTEPVLHRKRRTP